MLCRGKAWAAAMAAPALLAGAGCGRMAASTVVRADGSVTRTLKFSAGKQDTSGGLDFRPKLEDMFVLPSGPGWQVDRPASEAEAVYRATRTFKVGETVEPDIVLKAGQSAPGGRTVVGGVSVKRLSPGVFEYRETLHWVGARPKELTSIDPDILATVRAALPASLATDENVRQVSRGLFTEFWRMLFGPSDPLLTTALLHPDLAERRIMKRLRSAADDVALRTLGDRMTPEQRRAFVNKVAARAAEMAALPSKKPSQASESPSDNGAGLTPVFYSVTLPGKITATNGEVDGNEVYWAFYSMAAAPGDVVLTATCDVGK